MTRRSETIAAAYFEALYAADQDPWQFRSSPYEQEKYAATIAALSRPRYGRALEVGCSLGVLSGRLAERCDRLLAIDGSATALRAAREASACYANIGFEHRTVPNGFPPGSFDLIVLSEILYYLTHDDLNTVATQCLGALTRGGEIILCHWLGETDYPQTGLEATERYITAVGTRAASHTVLHDAVYRLDRLMV